MREPRDIIGVVRELQDARAQLSKVGYGNMPAPTTDLDTFNWHGKAWQHFPAIAQALLIAMGALDEIAGEFDRFAKCEGAEMHCTNWLCNASLIAEHSLKHIHSLTPHA